MPTLNWLGKDKVINHHQDVPFRVLDKQYTYGDEKTNNMFIHGDNLDALKALLPQYEGRIKCIYIDPPYNTGNEGWVYNDNVNDPKIKKWIGEVVGREGEDLSRHDKWLCMMYPRLKLLQRLLADDGAIFISIDDNEQANLRLICDEIFGSNNFVTQFPRVTKKGGKSTDVTAKNHDYVFMYIKSSNADLIGVSHTDSGYKNKDEHFEERGFYKVNQTLDYDSLGYSSNLDYVIELNGEVFYAGGSKEKWEERLSGNHERADWAWRWKKELFEFGLSNGFIEIHRGGERPRIYTKTYQNAKIESIGNEYHIAKIDRTKPLSTLEFTDNKYSNDNAKKVFNEIMNKGIFDYTKTPELITQLLHLVNENDFIVLDSFAGSGTTAHAVLNMNNADGGNRKFILVEMMDYAENITAERVRRVIDGYADKSGTGGGFTYYELDEPLLFEDGNLNEKVPAEKIYEYVWYTETKVAYTAQSIPYYLGEKSGTAYYFYYERDTVTALDEDFLKTITIKSERYVIYADMCALSKVDLERLNIVFKKIPRDITKL